MATALVPFSSSISLSVSRPSTACYLPGFSSFSSFVEYSKKRFSCSRIRCRATNENAANTSSQGFDPQRGVSVYKPKSYEVLVSDAANSLAFALQDGKYRLEIDFPPLPSSISSYKGSSDDFIDANIQLVLAVVRKLQEKRETRARIVFPDKPEKRRATEIFKTAFDSVTKI